MATIEKWIFPCRQQCMHISGYGNNRKMNIPMSKTVHANFRLWQQSKSEYPHVENIACKFQVMATIIALIVVNIVCLLQVIASLYRVLFGQLYVFFRLSNSRQGHITHLQARCIIYNCLYLSGYGNNRQVYITHRRAWQSGQAPYRDRGTSSKIQGACRLYPGR